MKKEFEITEELEEKILSRIDMKGDDECWNWKLRTNKLGRPIYTVDKIVDGKRQAYSLSVQRVVLERVQGKITSRYIDTTCGNLVCCNPAHLSDRSFEKRLWGNIYKSETGCWEWQGATFKGTGYGCISINSIPKLAHRVAYEEANGEIPEGLLVLHRCNNKLCINPDHLYAGTHNENMRDMANTDAVKGENNANSSLKESDVLEIRKLIKERKVYYGDIAKMYGVSREAIKDIARGRTWSWL